MLSVIETPLKTKVSKEVPLFEMTIVTEVMDHVRDFHSFPTDLPDNIFDILSVEGVLNLTAVSEMVRQDFDYLLNKFSRKYFTFEKILEIQPQVIGHIALIALLFPDFKSKANVVFLHLKQVNLLKTYRKKSDKGKQTLLQETKDRFYKKLDDKLAHIHYDDPAQEDNIRERIAAIRKNGALDEKIERILDLLTIEEED